MMSCAELKDLFELHALGVLDPEESAEVEQHLATGCAACSEAMQTALALNAMLLAQAAEVTPPARLKRRVLASVGVQRSGWGWTAAIAAAGMLVIALWLSVEVQKKDRELAGARKTLASVSADRDHIQQALAILDEPGARQVAFGTEAPAPHGNVFVEERRGVVLLGANLPALPAGKIYEMWMIPKDAAAPVPAGLFQPDAAGNALHVQPGPVNAAALGRVAVTVEPEAGSTAPATSPIIVAPFAL